MDSDALFHLKGIRLANVHDTQAWHMSIKRTQALPNIGATIAEFSVRGPLPPPKDRRIYDRPDFWATRPLTPQMVDVAAGDVQNLLELHSLQVAAASARQAQLACAESAKRLGVARDARVLNVKIRRSNLGLFIGRGGANIRAFDKANEVIMYNRHGSGDCDELYAVFVMYHATDEGLKRAAAKIHRDYN